MGGELSQEEINALLNNPDGSSGENAGATSQGGSDSEQALTAEEKDAIGEVANISMGTAATTLFSLVNRKVEISTPLYLWQRGTMWSRTMNARAYLSELHIPLDWMEVTSLC